MQPQTPTQDDFLRGILRVCNPGGQTVGTAFLVAPNLAVTCAHVACDAGASPGERLRLAFQAGGEPIHATVRADAWSAPEAQDIAVLALESPVPEGAVPLHLGASGGTAGHPFTTYGYPGAAGNAGLLGGGDILGATTLDGVKVLQLRSTEVTGGFSGAPVLDTRTRRAVGMVTAVMKPDAYGKLGETAFITPSEALRAICPELQLSDICPYRSLEAFTEADSEFYFGRTAAVERLLAGLRRSPLFLAVLGPSGSGKSSLVQAGLIPALRKGAILGSERWGILVARPGEQPYQQLEAVGLASVEQDMGQAVQAWLQAHPERSHLLLVLDQFEELLVSCPEALRQQFVANLAGLLDSPLPVNIILILRDDFFSRFTKQATALLPWMENSQIILPAELTVQELAEIVHQPAYAVGLQFETGLPEVIVDDVQAAGGRSAALPLLEFALTQLWERRQDGMLTHTDYQAIGGVTGGLAQWADRAYYALDQDDRFLVQRILIDLVHLGDESQGLPDSRQRRSVAELVRRPSEQDAVLRVVQHLADQRLLVTGGKEETAEIIHDALLREWGLLQSWLQEDRRFLAWRQEIGERAQDWQSREKDMGVLLRGVPLAEAEIWLAQRSPELGEAEQAYIKAGIQLRQQEASERESQRLRELQQAQKLVKTQRQRTMVLLAGLIIAVVLGMIAFSLGGVSFVLFRLSNANLTDAQAANTQSAANAATAQIASTQSAANAATAEAFAADAIANAAAAQAASTQSAANAATAEANAAEAQYQTNIALNRLAIAQSQFTLLDTGPHIIQSGLLAVEGLRGTSVLIADNAARRVLNILGFPVTKVMHDDSVNVVVFSPDGRWVASGDSDGIIRVWKSTDGTEIARMEHDEAVTAIAFSPNGQWIISGSTDDTARVWNVITSREIARMLHSNVVSYVAFNPDGQRVVSASWDGTVRVWEASTGIEISRMVHDGVVTAVAFSPDGHWLVSGGELSDATARVWDAATGEEITRVVHDRAVYAVAVSPDGQWVVTGDLSGNMSVWEAATGVEIARRTSGGSVFHVVFSPDGSWIASGSIAGIATVWETTTGREIARMAHEDEVEALAFSPDGRYLLSGSWDGTARVWDALTGTEIARMVHDDRVSAAAFSPDGRQIVSAGGRTVWVWEMNMEIGIASDDHTTAAAISQDGRQVVLGSDTGSIQVLDLISRIEVAHIIQNSLVSAIAISPDGKMVVSGECEESWNNQCLTGSAIVWEVATGIEVARMTHYGAVNAVAFSPDGRWIISGGANQDHTARVWDAYTGIEIARVTHDDWVAEVAFNPDGQWVVSAGGNTAWVWEARTGNIIASTTHDDRVSDVNFSPDGRWIVSQDGVGNGRVWEAATGAEIFRIPEPIDVGGYSTSNSAVFSPDGSLIVLVTYPGIVRVWDMVKGANIIYVIQDAYIKSAAFSPDGRWLVLGDSKGVVQVWEITTGVEVARVTHHSSISEVVFSPDGDQIISIDSNIARVWAWQPEDIIAELCARLPRNFTQEEWMQFFGDVPYHQTCPNLPIEPEPTPTPTP